MQDQDGSCGEHPGDLTLLLRLSHSWSSVISSEDLYEATRGYWKMALAKAERVSRVFAVADGVVREVYEPQGWHSCPRPGQENRIGFEGVVARDREEWIGADTSALFSPGSQNPVRYVPAEHLASLRAGGGSAPALEGTSMPGIDAAEPGTAEQVMPLLHALDGDLLWSMSRAAQELFHSNTLGWLMASHPTAACSLRALFEGSHPRGVATVFREWRNLDLVGENSLGGGRYMVENKLYSIPYPAQLEKYSSAALPWSTGHGPAGAPDTAYFLLTLMDPTFELPPPWRRISYEEVSRCLGEISSADLGVDADLFERYRTLVRRLVVLKDAVDPRNDLDGPFAVSRALSGTDLPQWFVGPLQRMRFTGLSQAVSEEFGESLPLRVAINNAKGSVTYERWLSATRGIGWQLEGNQLRLFVLVCDPGLAGKGQRLAAARAAVADADYIDWVDFTAAEDVLGDLLEPKKFPAGVWQKYDPEFVYRYRKIHPSTTTRQLAEALAELTAYTDSWPLEEQR